ncbi:MAG: hypothetical protein WC554_18015 [Clostridia bacterium]
MSEYISRETVVNGLEFVGAVHKGFGHTEAARACRQMVEAVNEIPAADVAPVVRGEWVHGCNEDAREYCYCSECSEDALKDKSGYTEFSDYCPNCGARMDAQEADHA